MGSRYVSYGPLELPPVEVELDGAWWPGVVRVEIIGSDGCLTYHVQYRVEGEMFLDHVPAQRVRERHRRRP